MNFFDTLTKMLILLFAIAMGYLANRRGFLNAEINRKLTDMVLEITLPLMIVGSVITGDELPARSVILSTLKVAVVFYGMAILAALVVARLLGGTPGQRGVGRCALVFPTMIFIGYPMVVAVFGPEALLYAVILTLPYDILAYTVGALMLGGKAGVDWKQLTSPCVVAAVLALILALCRVQLPTVAGELMNFVGNITGPLSLLVVGSLLAELPIGKVFADVRLWALTAVRLLVLPALLWLILRNMELAPLVLGVAVLEMAMPAGVGGVMLSMKYHGDTNYMAQLVFFSTLLAMITVPIVVSLL